MWIELAIGAAGTAIGIILAVAIGVKQTADARIASTQVGNFLIDFRADMNNETRAMRDKLDELLERAR